MANRDDQPNLRDLVPVTLVYDPALGSPADTQQYAGKYGVPPSYLPLPQRGVLFGQPGYSRQGAGGAWEWVMQGDTDPVDAFVDSLTGRGAWTNASSRATVKTLIARLFSAGIPRTTIAQQIPQFYQAVANEILAEQAAG